MRVKVELDIQVAMGEEDPKGTDCQGYLPEGTRYADIIRMFGKSQYGLSNDGKTKAEWSGRINGLVFTIYDYKSAVDPEQNTDWHIGGKLELVPQLVNIYFEAKR